MNIAHIQYSFSIENGGPTQSLSNYCRGQVASGHEVSVWTLEGFPHRSPAIRLPSPVKMHVFRVEPPAKLGCSAEMRRQLRLAESPDIYHLHGVWLQAMHYGAIEARRRNRPYVLEIAGMYEPFGLGQKWFLKRVARWCYQDRILREAACLHVNSNQEAEYLRKLGFKAPIAVIPVGVDVENIEKQKAEILPGEVACWNKEQIPQAKTDFTGQGPVKYAEDFTGQGNQPGEVISPLEYGKDSTGHGNFTGQGPVKYAEDFTGQGNQPGEVACPPGGVIASHSTGQGFHGPTAGEAADRKLHGATESEIESTLNGRPFVLYLSRIHPKKGLDLLIRAWATNRKAESGKQKTENWRLVIAGSGEQPYIDRCRRLAAELGVSEQCLWMGHVDELQKSWLFTHAHCYVLPTSGENFGNTVAESLAHGTPVITTRHTPWKDLEEHGCGWYVDNTEAEIGRALQEALSLDAIARRRMSDAGERLARERYSLRAVLSDINAVYEWLTGSAHIPACVRLDPAGARFSTPFAKPTGQDPETRLHKHITIQHLFDQKAASWSRKYGPHGSLRPRLYIFEKQLSELLKPPAAVLDFGCGTGNLTCHLFGCGYALTGCDISHEMIAWAKKNNSKASVSWEILPTDWQELPFAANTFDAIVVSSVFEYLVNIEIVLGELWRVLKPGGFVIATVPNSRHIARKVENIIWPMMNQLIKIPVLERINKVNCYATYLRYSRNRMPLNEWFAIGKQANFAVLEEERSRASKSVLVPVVFCKPNNKS